MLDATIPASLHALLGTFVRVSPLVHVRGVRSAGDRADRADRTANRGRQCSPVPGSRRWCRFKHRRRCPPRLDADRIGLALARLIVDRLLGEHAAIEVAIDDTLIRRWGPKVFGAFWTHDGSAQGPHALGRGNRWIIAGIVVTLPFCSHPVCLPILLRLWRGKGTDSPVRLAGELISILAQEFPDRRIHVVGDAAYHGKSLLVPGATITTRLPANAVLYAPAPPRTGGRGRPRLKGHRLGTPAEIAATAGWRRVRICRYGRVDTVEIAQTPSIWYGAFGNTAGRVVLVREPDGEKVLAIFTTRTPTAVPKRSAPATPTAGRSRPPSPAASNCSASARPATASSKRSNAPCRSSSASTASSSSGTHCTATTPTTSPAAASSSRGTPTRTSPPSKTCSPSSAEPFSQHELRVFPQLNPIPTNTAITNWPAPQPLHNCESQV